MEGANLFLLDQNTEPQNSGAKNRSNTEWHKQQQSVICAKWVRRDRRAGGGGGDDGVRALLRGGGGFRVGKISVTTILVPCVQLREPQSLGYAGCAKTNCWDTTPGAQNHSLGYTGYTRNCFGKSPPPFPVLYACGRPHMAGGHCSGSLMPTGPVAHLLSALGAPDKPFTSYHPPSFGCPPPWPPTAALTPTSPSRKRDRKQRYRRSDGYPMLMPC